MNSINDLLRFLMEYVTDDKYLVVMRTLRKNPLTLEDIHKKTGFAPSLILMYLYGKRFQYYNEGKKIFIHRWWENVDTKSIDPGKHMSTLGLIALGLVEKRESNFQLTKLGKDFLDFIK